MVGSDGGSDGFGSDGFGSDVIWFGWFWFGRVLVRNIRSEPDLVRTEPNLVRAVFVRTKFGSDEKTSIWGPNQIWFGWVRVPMQWFGWVRCGAGSDAIVVRMGQA